MGIKKLPVFKQPFVSVSAFTHYFTSFVEGCTLSTSDTRVFSVRHSWQFMVSLENFGAFFIMDQEAEKGVLLDFRFQI